MQYLISVNPITRENGISASKFWKIIAWGGRTQGASDLRVVERSWESFKEIVMDYSQKALLR